MKIVIRFTAKEEAKALPFILRHSPGMILKDRIYILPEDFVRLLKKEGYKFTELSRESQLAGEVISGERI